MPLVAYTEYADAKEFRKKVYSSMLANKEKVHQSCIRTNNATTHARHWHEERGSRFEDDGHFF